MEPVYGSEQQLWQRFIMVTCGQDTAWVVLLHKIHMYPIYHVSLGPPMKGTILLSIQPSGYL